MSIRRFFDQNVTVRRLRTISGDRKAYQATATVESHIQELDSEARQVLGILEGRGWTAWFSPDVDIKEGDRITDEKGVVYIVREVTVKDYSFGVNQHTEVILVEENA